MGTREADGHSDVQTGDLVPPFFVSIKSMLQVRCIPCSLIMVERHCSYDSKFKNTMKSTDKRS
jgi:hypothetical protein